MAEKVLVEDVRAELRKIANTEVRERTMRMIVGVTDSPARLNRAAWKIAVSARGTAARYETAYRAAEAATHARTLASYQNTLGAPLYRVGRFEEAVAALQRSVRLRGERGPS